MASVMGQIQQVMDAIRRQRDDAISDGQLLTQFVEQREQEAFTVLVHRHGPMVWGVCSRILRCPHDAADAFQATFLVLARRAGVIVPREQVGAWLHGVARQTSLRARALAARRGMREQQLNHEPAGQVARGDHDELRGMLDQALAGLPAKYRLPVVLCDLQEKTHRDVAQQLGWPMGTVAGRLVRGRQLLARRLARQGMALPAGGLAVLVAEGAAMPVWIFQATVEAAGLTAAVPVAGPLAGGTVAGLARGVMNAMFLSQCKVAAGVLATLAVSMVALSSVGWAHSGPVGLVPVVAALDHQSSPPAASGGAKKAADDPLRKLREEKVKVLTEAMHEVHRQRQKGNATFMDAALSHHLVCKAEFDLASTDEERMKALTKQVTWAKQIEENAKKLKEEGKFPVMDQYKVTTDRIDAEIALEKLKKSVHGGK